MNASKARTRLERYAAGETIKGIASSERRAYGTVHHSMVGMMSSFLRKVAEGSPVPVGIVWLERWAEGDQPSTFVRRGAPRTYASMSRLTPAIAAWALGYEPLTCPHCGQVVVR